MGDLNRVKAKVWCAKPEKIQDAFHFGLGKAVVDSHKHNANQNPDGSFTVEAVVRVDVGRVYRCLEKIASRIKIESFVQLEDVKADTTRQELEVCDNITQYYKEELVSELEGTEGNYYRHVEMKLTSVEEEEHKLIDRKTGQQIELKTTRHRTTRISVDDEVVEELRLIKMS